MYPWTSRVRWGFFLILKKTRRVFWAPFRLFSAGNRNADREPFLNRLVCGEWGGRRKCNSFVTVLYKHIQLVYIYLKKRSYLIKITSSTLHKYAHLFFSQQKVQPVTFNGPCGKKKPVFRCVMFGRSTTGSRSLPLRLKTPNSLPCV